MVSALIFLAMLVFMLLAWACWELGGEHIARSRSLNYVRLRSGEPSSGGFRLAGLVFAVLALLCARAIR